MTRTPIRNLTYTGIFAALVFLTTWIFHVPVGLNGGYIHFGDAMIYIAATVLPLPYAMAAGAIGAGLSDFLSPGGMVWILPTILIKALICIPFSRKGDQLLNKRNVAALLVGGIITIIGYFLAEAVITGGFAVPLAGLPLAFIQPAGSAFCYAIWGVALDKLPFRKRIINS